MRVVHALAGDKMINVSARRPVVSIWVWAWGPLMGLACWIAGFFVLPWWIAILVWWWPSALLGSGAGLVLVWLAKPAVAGTIDRIEE